MAEIGSIAFIARSETRFLMLEVVKELIRRHDVDAHLFCFGAQEVKFYKARNQDSMFASIIDADVLLSSTRTEGLIEAEVMARAAEIESALPRNYNSVVLGNRHLGRGYAQGGFYHPRSRYSEETNYVQMIHAYNETFDFWERKFRELDVKLVLNGTIEAAVVAGKLDIPYRVLASSRYKNQHFWAANEFYEDPRLAPYFERLQKDQIQIPDGAKVEPYYAHIVNRSLFVKKGVSFTAMIQKIGLQIARHTYWRLRRYAKARGYYLSSEIAYYYRVWRHFHKLETITQPLSALGGKKFVFFPLHLEPEISLQGLSPEYFFQLTTIAALSRDLPAGVMLAVKESFAAVGRRPDNFYQQINDLKNVVLLDTLVFGADVAREASVVATINGTAGLEAALEGKPVIVFGKHNNYECLPHVFRVDDHADLRSLLRQCLDNPGDSEMRRLDGRRYLKAVEDHSFDLGEYDFINLTKFDPDLVAAAATSLDQSLIAFDR